MINSRRTFLKQTLTGSVFLVSARALGHSLPDSDTPDSLKYLSTKEFLIVQAVAARIIGLDETSPMPASDVASRADVFLSTADPEVQYQFHTLLNAFNAPFFTFLFDWRFSSFIHMSAEDQDSYLEDWMTSNFAFRRTGFQALKRVCLSMYYTDSRSWREIHYDGMFLPWER